MFIRGSGNRIQQIYRNRFNAQSPGSQDHIDTILHSLSQANDAAGTDVKPGSYGGL